MTVVQEAFANKANSVWACDACGKDSGQPTTEVALLAQGWEIHLFRNGPRHHVCPRCAKQEVPA